MTSANTWIIVTLLVAIATYTGAVVEAPPQDCTCLDGTNSYGSSCATRGCSLGGNSGCSNYAFTATNVNTGSSSPVYYYGGCNCPASSFSYNPTNTPAPGVATDNNGYYNLIPSPGAAYYNYSSCSDFGGNAYDNSGTSVVNRGRAINCCNFCCNDNSR